MQQATLCYWRKANDSFWSKIGGELTDDGSDDMLALLVSDPLGYKEWAEDCFEAINPEAALNFTYAQAPEIGYPRDAA